MNGPLAILPGMDRFFSLGEARDLLADAIEMRAAILAVRADLAELEADIRAGERSPLGGLPELKGLNARLFSALEWFVANGVHVKGWAPLLLDFPGQRDGTAVQWCWLEGEPELEWYHRTDCGFAGRRPV
jgi:hypothetical protein